MDTRPLTDILMEKQEGVRKVKRILREIEQSLEPGTAALVSAVSEVVEERIAAELWFIQNTI